MLTRRFMTVLGLIVLLSATLLVTAPAVAAPQSKDVIPGRYIVVFKDNVPDAAGLAGTLAARHGFKPDFVYSHALKGFAGAIPPAVVSRLRADPTVAYIAEDKVVSIAAQTIPTGIDRIDGELSSTVSGNGSGSVNVDVAVIDTGIDRTHPDLNVVGGVNCVFGSPISFLSYNDDNGHGSHVAGTIAAKDDANGVVGVAPGARLWAVKVLTAAGSGTSSGVVCGIDWVAARSATIEVANMSLGGSGSDDNNCGNTNNDPQHRAICRAVSRGITFVVAAGNSAQNAASFTPAAYDEVITVSALADFDGKPGGLGAPTCRADVDDTFADFSNFGADVDLIAPGVCILSTWMTGGYNTISGTSMASPHVAGAAALYKANNPSASPAQVKSALQSAATLNWATATDPDGQPDKLLNVDPF